MLKKMSEIYKEKDQKISEVLFYLYKLDYEVPIYSIDKGLNTILKKRFGISTNINNISFSKELRPFSREILLNIPLFPEIDNILNEIDSILITARKDFWERGEEYTSIWIEKNKIRSEYYITKVEEKKRILEEIIQQEEDLCIVEDNLDYVEFIKKYMEEYGRKGIIIIPRHGWNTYHKDDRFFSLEKKKKIERIKRVSQGIEIGWVAPSQVAKSLEAVHSNLRYSHHYFHHKVYH